MQRIFFLPCYYTTREKILRNIMFLMCSESPRPSSYSNSHLELCQRLFLFFFPVKMAGISYFHNNYSLLLRYIKCCFKQGTVHEEELIIFFMLVHKKEKDWCRFMFSNLVGRVSGWIAVVKFMLLENGNVLAINGTIAW